MSLYASSIRRWKPSFPAAIANDPIMVNFAQYGFSGVVTKPYTVERLQQALQRILHGGQG